MATTDQLLGTQRQIPAGAQVAADESAAGYGVSGRLHPGDYIFWFIHDQPQVMNGSVAAREYITSGRGGAEFTKALLLEARIADIIAKRGLDGPASILEFASGYGRVTRHLPGVLPGFRVVTCDIHEQAVDFLGSLGLDACTSAHSPQAFALGQTFTVVFAFSFFTHMPRATWGDWLKALTRHVEPGGLLIFTAHEEVSQGLMGVAACEEDGFFFHTVSEQHDLSTEEYGNTVTTFSYVYAQAIASGLRLVEYKEAGAGHHDVYVFERVAANGGGAGWVPVTPAEVRALEAQLRAMRTSHSWRVTAPLRAVSRRLMRRT